MSEPLSQQIRTKIEVFFNAASDSIAYLHDRWGEEKEHEDFGEYVEAARKCCKEHGAEFISLSKRPFVLKFCIDKINLCIKVTSQQISWSTM